MAFTTPISLPAAAFSILRPIPPTIHTSSLGSSFCCSTRPLANRSIREHNQKNAHNQRHVLDVLFNNGNALRRLSSHLFMATNKMDEEHNDDKNEKRKKNKNKNKKKGDYETYDGIKNENNVTLSIQKKQKQKKSQIDDKKLEDEVTLLKKRLTQLECLVSSQSVEIRKLRKECKDLTEAAAAFADVVELLREAGLTISNDNKNNSDEKRKKSEEESDDLEISSKPTENTNTKASNIQKTQEQKEYEYFDDTEIFGSAPSSVIDAADSAGAAILAAMLGGKLRMLVDVRDAELSQDSEILVQFIELAILPVAAGLEGLTSERNHRLKIVFPTVSQLLLYRKSMALSAPEVVTLSTLGFDSVEESDNLVVVIAPKPDDEEGIAHLSRLLNPKTVEEQLRQPVVVVNYHMLPLSDIAVDFEKVYHLRLLSVQYMTGDMNPEYVEKIAGSSASEEEIAIESNIEAPEGSNDDESIADAKSFDEDLNIPDDLEVDDDNTTYSSDEDAALEAAMEHAHQIGVAQGITRAMVIRAFPRPWHVFVDTSPDKDADFEVAATFDEEPSQDEVNYAIIECLEGSEREDELVAQQMQEALEAGQLNRISEMLGGLEKDTDEDDEDDDFYFDLFNEDSC